MLSLGACLVDARHVRFYVELKPLNRNVAPGALQVGGLTLETLADSGQDPHAAMTDFKNWVLEAAASRTPVFVGFNAAFDWSFVNWYFHRLLGDNPFGIAALDIKSYYMGLVGCSWRDTTSSRLPAGFQPTHKQTHNALDDAIAQAEIFEKLLSAARGRA
jgi:DNA polymerase III epsilon subunit-like protein